MCTWFCDRCSSAWRESWRAPTLQWRVFASAKSSVQALAVADLSLCTLVFGDEVSRMRHVHRETHAHDRSHMRMHSLHTSVYRSTRSLTRPPHAAISFIGKMVSFDMYDICQLSVYLWLWRSALVINPRRACAVRVTVLGLSVPASTRF